MVINGDETVYNDLVKIKCEAIEKTGLDDFGNSFFEKPLAAWFIDLNRGHLNDFGRIFLRNLAYKDLCRRLKLINYLEQHREILEVEIPPIIMITAAPRTGTTLLHNLMGIHPLARTLLRWELIEPIPAPTSENYTTDRRIANLQASTEKLRGSLVERMHWINADDPEENTWGFTDCTGLFGRSIELIMSTWSQFLWEHDHRSTFRDFRRFIQVLLWKCPPPAGGHLLLKCVMTSNKIQMFADEFPEAKFVIVHRDPFRILCSAATLTESIYQPFIREQPGALYEDGLRERHMLKHLRKMFRSLVEFQKNESTKISNVRYSDLMNDAVSATNLLYRKMDTDIPIDLEQSIVAFLKKQRNGKRAKPPKHYKDYGYRINDVWTDPVVAEYCETFGIVPEKSRLAEAQIK